MSEFDDLLDRKSAARLLHVSPRTVDRIEEIPRVRIGQRRVLYREADLRAYVAARTEKGRAAA